ncbi:hypothetical protein BDV93DRAFT_517901 [Ceratobasidium sp. AG-I]|nr:hypothetical protein BDV93DRAFT_517901 [Ceratobasidium sp. AG-I]
MLMIVTTGLLLQQHGGQGPNSGLDDSEYSYLPDRPAPRASSNTGAASSCRLVCVTCDYYLTSSSGSDRQIWGLF